MLSTSASLITLSAFLLCILQPSLGIPIYPPQSLTLRMTKNEIKHFTIKPTIDDPYSMITILALSDGSSDNAHLLPSNEKPHLNIEPSSDYRSRGSELNYIHIPYREFLVDP